MMPCSLVSKVLDTCYLLRFKERDMKASEDLGFHFENDNETYQKLAEILLAAMINLVVFLRNVATELPK
jgi:hypothetical protein